MFNIIGHSRQLTPHLHCHLHILAKTETKMCKPCPNSSDGLLVTNHGFCGCILWTLKENVSLHYLIIKGLSINSYLKLKCM